LTHEFYAAHIMGQSQSTPNPAPVKSEPKVGKSGKKICCACPDTKKLRDECVVMKGEDDPDCIKMIEAHKVCLRAEGFTVK